ncbi:MAG: gfo/Idh/MocA family oxidoreductase, partial [Candidatus Aminicenantes bacterium]
MNNSNSNDNNLTRRDFIKTASAVSVASLAGALSGTGALFAGGSDTIRVGLIGCGGRGTGAAIDAVNSSPGVEILALYDPFQDRLEGCLKRLRERVPAAVKVKPEACFTG